MNKPSEPWIKDLDPQLVSELLLKLIEEQQLNKNNATQEIPQKKKKE